MNGENSNRFAYLAAAGFGLAASLGLVSVLRSGRADLHLMAPAAFALAAVLWFFVARRRSAQ